MTKTTVLLALALLTPSFAFASFDTNLQYGSAGTNVTELQEFLTTEGVYSGPISGNFFSLTRAGVIAFQTKYNIAPAAGFFGPITRTKANEIIAVADTAEEESVVSETGTSTPKTTTQNAPRNTGAAEDTTTTLKDKYAPYGGRVRADAWKEDTEVVVQIKNYFDAETPVVVVVENGSTIQATSGSSVCSETVRGTTEKGCYAEYHYTATNPSINVTALGQTQTLEVGRSVSWLVD